MKFLPLAIPGAFSIELLPNQDHRGFLVRTYDEQQFESQGLVTHWIQESHFVLSCKGTLRRSAFSRAAVCRDKVDPCGPGKISSCWWICVKVPLLW